eukprot:5292238-Heterocapsa_arctica.AAC.1
MFRCAPPFPAIPKGNLGSEAKAHVKPYWPTKPADADRCANDLRRTLTGAQKECKHKVTLMFVR